MVHIFSCTYNRGIKFIFIIFFILKIYLGIFELTESKYSFHSILKITAWLLIILPNYSESFRSIHNQSLSIACS